MDSGEAIPNQLSLLLYCKSGSPGSHTLTGKGAAWIEIRREGIELRRQKQEEKARY